MNGRVGALGSVALKLHGSVRADQMHVDISIVWLHVFMFLNPLPSNLHGTSTLTFDPVFFGFQVPSVVSTGVPRGRKGVVEVSLNRGPSGHR